MSKHRWEQWIESEEVKKLLRKARDQLKTAWEWDRKDPASYPFNTSYALAAIQETLSMRPHKNTPFRPPESNEPKTLAELVPESLIETIYEEHHAGTFRDAIRRADGIDYKETKKGWKAFRGIIRAIEMAYLVHYLGIEFLSKPKVSILHRGLKQIAKTAGLQGQTEEGLAEFLDDLCPCGLRCHREAVRKLSSRSVRIRRAGV